MLSRRVHVRGTLPQSPPSLKTGETRRLGGWLGTPPPERGRSTAQRSGGGRNPLPIPPLFKGREEAAARSESYAIPCVRRDGGGRRDAHSGAGRAGRGTSTTSPAYVRQVEARLSDCGNENGRRAPADHGFSKSQTAVRRQEDSEVMLI